MAKIKKQSQALSVATKEYTATLAALKQQVQEAQIKASLAANKELIKLLVNWQDDCRKTRNGRVGFGYH